MAPVLQSRPLRLTLAHRSKTMRSHRWRRLVQTRHQVQASAMLRPRRAFRGRRQQMRQQEGGPESAQRDKRSPLKAQARARAQKPALHPDHERPTILPKNLRPHALRRTAHPRSASTLTPETTRNDCTLAAAVRVPARAPRKRRARRRARTPTPPPLPAGWRAGGLAQPPLGWRPPIAPAE